VGGKVGLVDEMSEWWMAADGNWYPPELLPGRRKSVHRPAGGATALGTRPMAPRSELVSPHPGGRCIQCGQTIGAQDTAWLDTDIAAAMCLRCWPVEERVPVTRPRTDPRWRRGGEGEYLMSLRLHRDLGDQAVVLDHRRIDGGLGAVDHLVVASSGVWVVASKRMDGLIEHRTPGGALEGDGRLLVGGQDLSPMVEAIYEQVIPVANLVTEPAVPVVPAVVFVEGNWGGPSRLLTKRPSRHQGVWILWPAALIAKMEEPGPLDSAAVIRIGDALDRALSPV
jgi:hypothetical protein